MHKTDYNKKLQEDISDNVCSYTFTLLTDVKQEQTGVYCFDRSSKFDMKRIHAIFPKHPKDSK